MALEFAQCFLIRIQASAGRAVAYRMLGTLGRSVTRGPKAQIECTLAPLLGKLKALKPAFAQEHFPQSYCRRKL